MGLRALGGHRCLYAVPRGLSPQGHVMRRALFVSLALLSGCLVHGKGGAKSGGRSASAAAGTPWHSDFSSGDYMGEWNAGPKHKFALDNITVKEEPGPF